LWKYVEYITTVFRFCKGLSILGVHRAIKEHPEVWREVFVVGDRPIRANEVESLYSDIRRSATGSNKFTTEGKIIGWFKDFLLEVEGSHQNSWVHFQLNTLYLHN